MEDEKKKIDYEAFYNDYVKGLKDQHEQNQKRIRVGMWVNILIPLIFLILSFLISTSKLVFLTLWIVSLFGIAFYLINVEYLDFKMQDTLSKMGENEINPLIGERIEEVSGKVGDKADEIDLHVENTKNEIKHKAKKIISKKDDVISKIKKNIGGSEDEHN